MIVRLGEGFARLSLCGGRWLHRIRCPPTILAISGAWVRSRWRWVLVLLLRRCRWRSPMRRVRLVRRGRVPRMRRRRRRRRLGARRIVRRRVRLMAPRLPPLAPRLPRVRLRLPVVLIVLAVDWRPGCRLTVGLRPVMARPRLVLSSRRRPRRVSCPVRRRRPRSRRRRASWARSSVMAPPIAPMAAS